MLCCVVNVANGAQQVLAVWLLFRKAVLAARSSCEQVLLDDVSLAIGFS